MPAPQKRQRKKESRQARQQAELAARRRRGRRTTFVAMLVVLAVIIGLITALSGGGGGKSTKASTTNTTAGALKAVPPGASVIGDTPCPKPDGSSPRTTSFAKPPPMCIDPAKSYKATMVTTKGTMTITLDAKAAPKTVNNFVVLARYHFYDGIAFHRIVPGFVIQVGDLQETGTGGPGYQFADELPAANQYKLGSLAMANSGPNTNGSQFFVITGQQGVQLQPQYSLFGQVTEGLDVAQKIGALGNSTDPKGTPTQVVKITSITVTES